MVDFSDDNVFTDQVALADPADGYVCPSFVGGDFENFTNGAASSIQAGPARGRPRHPMTAGVERDSGAAVWQSPGGGRPAWRPPRDRAWPPVEADASWPAPAPATPTWPGT